MQYDVIIEHFAERHYIKSFAKKYKKSWDITLETIIQEFQQVGILFTRSIAETICDTHTIKICKTEFKIAGTNESRKSSGNRCIIAIQKETSVVHVLLVYTKTDIEGHHETNWWKNTIKDNYPEYKDII
jgi:hypothetical protein